MAAYTDGMQAALALLEPEWVLTLVLTLTRRNGVKHPETQTAAIRLTYADSATTTNDAKHVARD